MTDEIFCTDWQQPTITRLEGKHVLITRLNPDGDVNDLYEVSHASEKFKSLWTYMHYGPFCDKDAMYAWLLSIKESRDPMFFSVYSKEIHKKVGMHAVMNISTRDGRAELGNIWYSPLAQKSNVNTEATYLFLCHLFNELKYRRVEWKCDNNNEASKRAALRLGFSYEGLFRQHMVVKGKNRDTAWFAMIDAEWVKRKDNLKDISHMQGCLSRD